MQASGKPPLVKPPGIQSSFADISFPDGNLKLNFEGCVTSMRDRSQSLQRPNGTPTSNSSFVTFKSSLLNRHRSTSSVSVDDGITNCASSIAPNKSRPYLLKMSVLLLKRHAQTSANKNKKKTERISCYTI